MTEAGASVCLILATALTEIKDFLRRGAKNQNLLLKTVQTPEETH